ncbi:hypothetical protein U1Q18_047601 [Sarracenia purpurea var. burkii]
MLDVCATASPNDIVAYKFANCVFHVQKGNQEGGGKKERGEMKRKRKYNVKWNDEVTAEQMEAYRMKKVHHDDPMKDFLH